MNFSSKRVTSISLKVYLHLHQTTLHILVNNRRSIIASDELTFMKRVVKYC
jgi:hypothetical protein